MACVWLSYSVFADRLLDAFVVRQWTQDNGLPSSQIADLEAGPDGFLWLATGSAVYRFDGVTAEPLLDLAETNKLIASFVTLSSNSAYVSSLTDVYRCDATATPRNTRLYDQADGMETIECTGGFAPAGLVLNDGRLLFPTLNGLTCVDPERLTRATVNL
jgi:ligand-binding sensor domain-containing protein